MTLHHDPLVIIFSYFSILDKIVKNTQKTGSLKMTKKFVIFNKP